MKLRYAAMSLVIAAGAFISRAADQDFLQFEALVPPQFGIAEAQALADAQRISIYGLCGTCVFKKKEGAVWIFTTRNGYAGLKVADILVVEPSVKLLIFGDEKEINASAVPAPMAASIPENASALAVAHL